MDINPVLAQQIDTLLKLLKIDNGKRSYAIKQNLATAIRSAANVSDVEDESKYIRIEAHFKILLDKLLDFLNGVPHKQNTMQQATNEAVLQELEVRLQKFTEYQSNLPSDEPATLDVLQAEFEEFTASFEHLIEDDKLESRLVALAETAVVSRKRFEKSYKSIKSVIDDLGMRVSSDIKQRMDDCLVQYLESGGKETSIFETLDDLQSRYKDNEQILELTDNIKTSARDDRLLRDYYIQKNVLGILQHTEAIRLDPELEFTPEIFDRLAQCAAYMNAKPEKEYFETVSEHLSEKQSTEKLKMWLELSGKQDVRDIDIQALRTAILTSLPHTLPIAAVRNKLLEAHGVEYMLAAILFTGAREQLDFSDSISIRDISTLFYVDRNALKPAMEKQVAAQQRLFLDAIEWRTLVLNEQFMQVVDNLLFASNMPDETQTKVRALLNRDANLHSENAVLAGATSTEFLREIREIREIRAEKERQVAQKLPTAEKRTTTSARKSPTINRKPVDPRAYEKFRAAAEKLQAAATAAKQQPRTKLGTPALNKATRDVTPEDQQETAQTPPRPTRRPSHKA